MPELPELEILKNELKEHVVGRRVRELVFPEGSEGGCPVEKWKVAVQGAAIVDVRRRGKMLVLELDSGYSLVIHLMMVGQLLLSSLYDGEPSDVRLALVFDSHQLTLGQVHLKFVRLTPTEEVELLPELKKLGLDPTSVEFTTEALREMLAQRKGKIKSFLLDQRHIAGVGNTYADEILFDARLAPSRAASSLEKQEVERLHDSIVTILERGLELGGSSEMAFVHLDGSKGGLQERFQVKGRRGEPCFVCGTPIEKVSIGGRGTYFCPRCQR